MRPGLLLRLLPSTFAIQAGFHGYTAALPVSLAGAAFSDGQIGLIVGTAAATQMVAAPVVGALLDRTGPWRILLVGSVAYLLATSLLAFAPLDPDAPIWVWLLARALQGIGFAIVIPAVLTLIPLLVPLTTRGFWLSVVLLSQNMTLAILPAASLVVLQATSLQGLSIIVAALVLTGTIMSRTIVRPASPGQPAEPSDRPGPARRRAGLAFRASWFMPLTVTLFAVAYWGTLFAYLPPRAEVAGTSSGFFFLGYGVSVLASRLATGWLADRYEARLLVLSGLAISGAAIALLLLEPTTVTLIAAGSLAGLAAGLVLSPMLLELSRRSTDTDRGSAFSLFSVVSGGANALGAIGGAPLVENFGFGAALLAGLLGVVIAAILVALDPSFRGEGRLEAISDKGSDWSSESAS